MKLYEKFIIEPKYVISIKNNDKKTIYQKYPTIQKIFNSNIELYIQDTINNNKEIPSKITLIDDDNIEYNIEDYYFIKFIIRNITNLRNIKYGVFKINNNIIKINEEYEKDKIKYNKSYINEKLLLFLTGSVAITNFILYKILS